MNKTLDYYMTLRYPIEITDIPEEEGGGVSACIPLLGRYSCIADGETVQDAMEDLKGVKQDLLRDLLERGIAIPEPQTQKENEFSGRILVRMPNSLHMHITEKAESNGESLNKYIVRTLSADIERSQIDDLKNLLVGISRLVEALKVQVNSYQIAMTNTYVGAADVVTRGMIGNWTGFPNMSAPNRSFEAQGGSEILSFLLETIESRNDSAKRTWYLANK